jgi:prepilin-type N-terminal cleavage/methylation domain-containing protein
MYRTMSNGDLKLEGKFEKSLPFFMGWEYDRNVGLRNNKGAGMRKAGFTLMELMVVVAIIFFLAAISVPQYFKYVARVKQAEVAINLASLHTAMQTYYAENGSYPAALGGSGGAGWAPAGYRGGGKRESFLYSYGFNVPGAQEGIHYFTGSLETPVEFLGTTYIEQDAFVAAAAADIQGRGVVDVWNIDETRKIENVGRGID